MKKIWTLTIVMVVAAAFLATPCLAKTTWNANSVWPPKNNHSVGLTEFAEKVKKATNGELDIVVHTGGALGFKGPDLLKAVRDGLVPVSDMLISGVAGLPAADIWFNYLMHGGAMTSRIWWGLGLLGWAAGLSGAAALATLGSYAWRTRRLQVEFLQIYRDDLMVTIEDRVYQALKQVYGLIHGLSTHLFKYMRQNYDALAEYARSSYVSRLPEDSFTFRSRFHPELNRRILTPTGSRAPNQPGQMAQPPFGDLQREMQYQVALYLAGGRAAGDAATTPEAARRAREALTRALPGIPVFGPKNTGFRPIRAPEMNLTY